MTAQKRKEKMKELINKLREAALESFAYSELLTKAADMLLDCRNEMCLKCGQYAEEECNWCRWKDV